MNETKGEAESCSGEFGVVLCLLVLDGDVVEDADVEADQHGELTGDLEAAFHVFFSDLLDFLEVVGVLHFLSDAFSVAKKRDDFVSVGIARD